MLLALALACTPPKIGDSGTQPLPEDVTVEAALVEESPSSILVSWELGAHEVQEVQLHASWSDGYQLDRSAAAEDGQAVLWGLHPEAEVDLEVTLVGTDQTWTESFALTTAALPVDLPALVKGGANPIPGELLLTTFVLEPPAAVMIDGEGEVRWWRMVEQLPELSRVRFSPDGQGLIGVAANPHAELDRSLVYLPLAGGPPQFLPLDQAHHDFILHEDGTLATFVHELREVKGQDLLGDRIVELAPDGTQTVVFDAWEVFDPSAAAANPAGVGFTHANFLVYDADRGDYLVSFFGRWTIDRISRSTGELIWELGASAESDFHTPDGIDWMIEGTHGFELFDDRLLYFENGTLDRGLSRVVELRVDEEQRIVEPIWAYDNGTGLYTVSLGDVNRLPDGNTLVVYATNGRMEVVNLDRELQWQLEAEIGGIFGYIERIPDPAVHQP